MWVQLAFILPRPRGHYGVRGLRPSAPRYPGRKPDIDKLTRAVLDALVAGGGIRDDARVVRLHADKTYFRRRRGPGVAVLAGAREAAPQLAPRCAAATVTFDGCATIERLELSRWGIIPDPEGGDKAHTLKRSNDGTAKRPRVAGSVGCPDLVVARLRSP